MGERDIRQTQVLRVVVLEGAVNLAIMSAKAWVGFATGSIAILGDAVHSFTDLINNIVAVFVVRLSSRPADKNHPYGHQKFELLAVFGLSILLAILAWEIAARALTRDASEVLENQWGLVVMLGVLVTNFALALWQRYWARRLNSKILDADARHTAADVLTTVVVIVGWQLSARGLVWLDTVCALGVAAFVLYLAYDLFRGVLPTLVDEAGVDLDQISEAVARVSGVARVSRVRSRQVADDLVVDMVIAVSAELSAVQAHEIADRVEHLLLDLFGIRDTTIHIEPELVNDTGHKG